MPQVEHFIDRNMSDSDSEASIACVTITREDGRKARAWVEAVILVNGRCQFRISALGKTKGSDSSKTVIGAWHDDLR